MTFVTPTHRTKIHLVNLSLCCLIPVGTVFVAQPTFIFGRTGGDEKSDEYFKGIAILMAAAVINAIANVLQAIYKGITRPNHGATFAVKSVALYYKPITYFNFCGCLFGCLSYP